MREVGEQALILEAHHTTHIEGTRLTLDQAERLWKGEAVPEADLDDARELLNYRTAFEFVSECLDSGDPITEGMIREIHRRLVEGVRGGSEQVIRRDVLVKQHGLNERQSKALVHLIQHGKLTIQDFEALLCPTVNRSSLQRDLKGMLDKNLITVEGATNQLVYRLAGDLRQTRDKTCDGLTTRLATRTPASFTDQVPTK